MNHYWERLLTILRARRRAYHLCFGTEAGNAVMHDLAIFCRANETCFHPDPRKHAVAEGRREVWLRIQHHMNLTGEQLAALYSPGVQPPSEGD